MLARHNRLNPASCQHPPFTELQARTQDRVGCSGAHRQGRVCATRQRPAPYIRHVMPTRGAGEPRGAMAVVVCRRTDGVGSVTPRIAPRATPSRESPGCRHSRRWCPKAARRLARFRLRQRPARDSTTAGFAPHRAGAAGAQNPFYASRLTPHRLQNLIFASGLTPHRLQKPIFASRLTPHRLQKLIFASGLTHTLAPDPELGSAARPPPKPRGDPCVAQRPGLFPGAVAPRPPWSGPRKGGEQ